VLEPLGCPGVVHPDEECSPARVQRSTRLNRTASPSYAEPPMPRPGPTKVGARVQVEPVFAAASSRSNDPCRSAKLIDFCPTGSPLPVDACACGRGRARGSAFPAAAHPIVVHAIRLDPSTVSGPAHPLSGSLRTPRRRGASHPEVADCGCRGVGDRHFLWGAQQCGGGSAGGPASAAATPAGRAAQRRPRAGSRGLLHRQDAEHTADGRRRPALPLAARVDPCET
jgi:hypothetical protein